MQKKRKKSSYDKCGINSTDEMKAPSEANKWNKAAHSSRNKNHETLWTSATNPISKPPFNTYKSIWHCLLAMVQIHVVVVIPRVCVYSKRGENRKQKASVVTCKQKSIRGQTSSQAVTCLEVGEEKNYWTSPGDFSKTAAAISESLLLPFLKI